MIQAHLPALMGCYSAMVAYCSRETHPTILDLLRRGGVAVHVDEGPPTGISRIGAVRRGCLRLGLQTGASYLQTCDFDRALHWVAHYPQELKTVVADIPNYDLLVLGRTKRAWATHPAYQSDTEPLFNHVFALVTGLDWDVGAGSRGLSRRAAEMISRTSQESTVGIDAEWPLLALGQDGFRVGHRRCEGLEFETADRFALEIEASGGYKAWEDAMNANPEQWVFRLRIALMIAEAAVRYGYSNE
jgi:hypothetical protein